ncbi:MAG TPA: glycosyltransferase [Candidatus Baltobacteraceae bacterium]|nr:glycosyltransferase [Candidatus Baltobacteraceae bacterium]
MSACTVVIATYNRRRVLAGTLRKLTALPEAPSIVVVDNGSRDGTARTVAREFPEVLLLRLPRNVGAAGRTVGARAAKTRYVAFCDDDCWWEPGAIAHASALLDAHPGVAVLNARVVVNGAVDEACALMERSTLPKRTACPGRAIGQFMAGASIVRRDAFLEAGGYDERYLIGAEESLLAVDLLERGWELIYADELVLHHAPSPVARATDVRRRLVMRNRLWTMWLRRSPRAVRRATFALACDALHDPVARAALAGALRGLPWIVRERRAVRPQVERMMERLIELPA